MKALCVGGLFDRQWRECGTHARMWVFAIMPAATDSRVATEQPVVRQEVYWVHPVLHDVHGTPCTALLIHEGLSVAQAMDRLMASYAGAA